MKTKLPGKLAKAAAMLLLSTLNFQPSTAQPSTGFAQSTAFTYQGRLLESGQPASGYYDFAFQLLDGSPTGGPTNTQAGVFVTNGLFTTLLDFGSSAFAGTPPSLQIGVRHPGQESFVTLSPLNPMTPVPYALAAGRVASGGLTSGAYNNPVTISNVANAFGGSFFGDGSGLVHVDAGKFGGLDPADFWQTTGNAGTTAGVNFLGTTDNQALQLRSDNQTGLQIQYVSRSTVSGMNLVAGYWGNSVMNNALGATVAGGGYFDSNGSASSPNSVTGDFGTVGGGFNNSAGAGATVAGGAYNSAGDGWATVSGGTDNNAGNSATVGGGASNSALGNSATVAGGQGNRADDTGATVGGGVNNVASGIGAVIAGGGCDAVSSPGNVASGTTSVISGGEANTASGDSATIGGGAVNGATGFGATVAGGGFNRATNSQATVSGGEFNLAGGENATIPGGSGNAALGFASFAAGYYAKALDHGAFVWSDNSGLDTVSQGEATFTARARGGFFFYTDTQGSGAKLASGSGTWNMMSDRNAKKDFVPVDSQAVLAQVTALPLTTWSYKAEQGARHLGPMAQDFHAAFGLNGDDDRYIAEVDEGGVALAAIQGLNQKVDERVSQLETGLKRRDAENAELKRQNEALAKRLEALEKIIRRRDPN